MACTENFTWCKLGALVGDNYMQGKEDEKG